MSECIARLASVGVCTTCLGSGTRHWGGGYGFRMCGFALLRFGTTTLDTTWRNYRVFSWFILRVFSFHKRSR